jgi:hypothetical protein
MILFLTILHHLCIIIEFVVVVTLTGLVVVLSYDMLTGYRIESKTQKKDTAAKAKANVRDMMAKENLRRQKEAEAHEGFFEESYVSGFDSNGALYTRMVCVPTEEAMAYYRQMTRLADEVIFDNTKDL